MMEARIPFSGFYESLWSNGIDEEESQWAERLAEEHDIKQDAIQELLYRHTTYSLAYRYIAERYALKFQQHINSELNLNVFMAYKDMSSPKYYNFETDNIYVELSYPDALRLARRVGRNALRKAAKAMFTSRDGFISFYSPHIEEWGQLRTWDHNQLYALLTAAADAIGEDDYNWDIYEDMSCNGDFNIAHDKAIDYNTVMFEIGKLVAAKEIAEEAEEQDDGRRFPVAYATTQDYVERYEAANKHIHNSNKIEGDL
jgi:hypothetical protein